MAAIIVEKTSKTSAVSFSVFTDYTAKTPLDYFAPLDFKGLFPLIILRYIS
ncbi:MAG: hypothetical protein ACYCWE_06185 [Eubacteriales bacterium]